MDTDNYYSSDNHETQELTAIEKRRKAYAESDLPYCFRYKITTAFDGLKCPICGITMAKCYTTSAPSIQHNIPISRGGKHELDNISVICRSCNESIGNKKSLHHTIQS